MGGVTIVLGRLPLLALLPSRLPLVLLDHFPQFIDALVELSLINASLPELGSTSKISCVIMPSFHRRVVAL